MTLKMSKMSTIKEVCINNWQMVILNAWIVCLHVVLWWTGVQLCATSCSAVVNGHQLPALLNKIKSRIEMGGWSLFKDLLSLTSQTSPSIIDELLESAGSSGTDAAPPSDHNSEDGTCHRRMEQITNTLLHILKAENFLENYSSISCKQHWYQHASSPPSSWHLHGLSEQTKRWSSKCLKVMYWTSAYKACLRPNAMMRASVSPEQSHKATALASECKRWTFVCSLLLYEVHFSSQYSESCWRPFLKTSRTDSSPWPVP